MALDPNKFTRKTGEALQAAQALGRDAGNTEIAPEHVLRVLLDQKFVKDDSKTISPDEMMTGTTGAMGATTSTTMAGTSGAGSSVAAMSKGLKVPMKCFYSAKAAIGMAIPVGILGLLLVVSRRKETKRMLGIMGIVLGGVTMAVPTLVGTCGSASAICNEVLKPTMLLAGGAVLVLSVLVLVLGEFRREPAI